MQEMSTEDGTVPEYNWLLFMHVEELLDKSAWKSLRLPEQIIEMYVMNALTTFEQSEMKRCCPSFVPSFDSGCHYEDL